MESTRRTYSLVKLFIPSMKVLTSSFDWKNPSAPDREAMRVHLKIQDAMPFRLGIRPPVRIGPQAEDGASPGIEASVAQIRLE